MFLKQILNSFYSARLQEGIPGSEADTLQKLDVPVMNIDQCKRILNSTHRRENVREEKNLCAGGQKGYQYDLNIHIYNDLSWRHNYFVYNIDNFVVICRKR